jgi:DUF1680 family protein
MVASVGEYFYSATPDTLYVHLYNQNQAQISVGGSLVQLEQQTNYPWDGDVRIKVNPDHPTQFSLALRIPGWSRDYHLEVNGKPVNSSPSKGYIQISREWTNGDEVTLRLAMPVERIAAHPHVRQDVGCIALQRGPVVYCLEQADNGPDLANVVVPRDARLTAEFDKDLFGGVCVITGEAVRVEPQPWPGGLYQPQAALNYVQSPIAIKAIPYCFWANREPGEMHVWVRES